MSNRWLQVTLFRRLLLEWVALALGLLACVVWLAGSGLTQQIDDFVYDRLLSVSTREADPRIVLLNIDDASLASVGAWPWNRATHGQLFEQLAKVQPKAVLFDVILTEPAIQAADDQMMVNGMRQLSAVSRLVTPVLLTDNHRGGLALTRPIEPVLSVSQQGHIAILPDADGVIREVTIDRRDDQGHVWPLMTTVLDDSLSKQGHFRIPFESPLGSYMSFSVSQVLEGQVSADFLKDKYVLIGATATGLGDRYSTPNAKTFSTMSGVEIHAHILDALLHGLSVRVVSGAWWALIPGLVLLLLLLAVSERYHLWVFLAVLAAYVTSVALALWWGLYWVAPMAGVCGVLGAYVLWSWRRMAVMLRFVHGELDSWQKQTGGLAQLLPAIRTVGMVRQPVESSMAQVQYLSVFVAESLQHLPVAVLLVDDDGAVLMYNDRALAVLGQRALLLHRSIKKLLDMPVIGSLAALNLQEWHDSGRVFQLHVVAMKSRHPHASGSTAYMNKTKNELTIWQVSLIDLSDERTVRQQHGDLMAFLSHDMRVPQVGILSLIEMYQAQHSSLSITSLLAQIDEKVQVTLDAANDLVHLSQAQSGQYQMMEVNTVTLLYGAVSQTRAQALANQVTLMIDHAMDELFEQSWVWGDGGMLTRALMNLLTNAIRYGDGGSTVFVSSQLRDGHVCIHIRDQGVGIDPMQLAVLNECVRLNHFERKPITASSDRANSLGIGLHMVTTVVAHHQGQLAFYDATQLGFERGVLVELCLPALPVDDTEDLVVTEVSND